VAVAVVQVIVLELLVQVVQAVVATVKVRQQVRLQVL
jgi:hypothetical protein